MDNCENKVKLGIEKWELRAYLSRVGLAVLVLTAVNVGIQLLSSALVAAFLPSVAESWWFVWVASVVPLYCFALPLFILSLPSHPFSSGEKSKLSFGGVCIALLVSFATMATFSIASSLIVELLRVLSNGRFFGADSLTEMVTSTPVYVTILVACVIAPIGEEFIFRKLLIDRLQVFGELSACLISGIIFGLFHLNLSQALYAAPLGMVLAYVYIRTRNIVYPIIMHAAVNFFGTVVIPALSSYSIEALESENLFEQLLGSLVFLGILAVGAAVVIGAVVTVVIMAVKKKIFFKKSEVFSGGNVLGIAFTTVGFIAMTLLFVIMIVLTAIS